MRNNIPSYLAGLIDGEGCFSAWKYWNDNRTDCQPYYQYSCRVTITNTSLALMKWLITNFGGSYRCAYPETKKHKARYEWRPRGNRNTKLLILAILPYLIIKKEQAELLLEFLELGYNPQQRDKIVQRLNVLNRKGPVETDTPDGSNEPKIQSELIGDDESESSGS